MTCRNRLYQVCLLLLGGNLLQGKYSTFTSSPTGRNIQWGQNWESLSRCGLESLGHFASTNRGKNRGREDKKRQEQKDKTGPQDRKIAAIQRKGGNRETKHKGNAKPDELDKGKILSMRV